MKQVLGLILFFAVVAFGQTPRKPRPHPDYVPNEITAERIAEAVLEARFGESRVREQLPLRAYDDQHGKWIVQGQEPGPVRTGGGLTVWINKHSGCIENVMEHMK